MKTQQAEQLEEKDPNVIEDLTLVETETANIKGGVLFDPFRNLNGIEGETSEPRPQR